MDKSVNRIALLTSGGDAPGMNACIRAVVRSAIHYNIEVYGIMRGYDGLIQNLFEPMSSRSVSNIIHRGGTMLKTARSEAFRTREGMEKAWENLSNFGIDALVTIGGDGTFKGALEFSKLYDFNVIGIPGTIDNDLYGTDFTIGYDTATNTVIECIDKIRDTADSHDRLFFIEVMGRDAGNIALTTGVAAGTEAILIPETKTSIDALVNILENASKNKKNSGLVVVAEGDEEGGAMEVARKVSERFKDYEVKVTILGHIQRGGNPSCFDRVLASRLGVAAVEGLLLGRSRVMVGLIDNKVVYTQLSKAAKQNGELDEELVRIGKILSK